MADSHPSIAHLRYRKCPIPDTQLVVAEMRELLRYDELRGGFTWIKLRGRVPLKLLGLAAGGDSGRGYTTINLLHQKFATHRLVWLWHYGEWPPGMLDHINGDRKDNRVENLRMATTLQNTWNRVRTSGELATGVAKAAHGDGYHTRIQVPGSPERAYLGTFDTEAEACAAYIGAATILHGNFAAHMRRVRQV